jgi:hypothetical protein
MHQKSLLDDHQPDGEGHSGKEMLLEMEKISAIFAPTIFMHLGHSIHFIESARGQGEMVEYILGCLER